MLHSTVLGYTYYYGLYFAVSGYLCYFIISGYLCYVMLYFTVSGYMRYIMLCFTVSGYIQVELFRTQYSSRFRVVVRCWFPSEYNSHHFSLWKVLTVFQKYIKQLIHTYNEFCFDQWPVADQGFPTEGTNPREEVRQRIIWQNYCWKLHENEWIWTKYCWCPPRGSTTGDSFCWYRPHIGKWAHTRPQKTRNLNWLF